MKEIVIGMFPNSSILISREGNAVCAEGPAKNELILSELVVMV
jgi:hypothetical protein